MEERGSRIAHHDRLGEHEPAHALGAGRRRERSGVADRRAALRQQRVDVERESGEARVGSRLRRELLPDRSVGRVLSTLRDQDSDHREHAGVAAVHEVNLHRKLVARHGVLAGRVEVELQ